LKTRHPGKLHVIPDCGHYVPLERPDMLNAILKPLIDDLGAFTE
jgi:pimeloyl-ACP methyl ester carboxylesterase